MHRHPNSVAIFQTDGRVKFTYPGGKSEERDMKAGQAIWTPATKHLPENLTDSDMEVILVEMKRDEGQPPRSLLTQTRHPTSSD